MLRYDANSENLFVANPIKSLNAEFKFQDMTASYLPVKNIIFDFKISRSLTAQQSALINNYLKEN